MEYIELRKSKLHSLRSDIAGLRQTYVEMQGRFNTNEWLVVGLAYVAIAAFLNGELSRSRHQIRNYMLGLEGKEIQEAGERHTAELRTLIRDILDARENIEYQENKSTRELAMEAHQQLVIEGEQQKISNRLQSIQNITELLENEIYDGRE